jgi:hypothetical protein
MIFVAAATEPTIILMLAEADIQAMREGRTQFVDSRQTGGLKFDRVALSLHRTNEDALALLKGAGHDMSNLPSPVPTAKEGRCDDCKGCIAVELLFEGKCNVCWATLAKKLMTASN